MRWLRARCPKRVLPPGYAKIQGHGHEANVLEFNELKGADRGQAETCTLVIGQKNYSSWSMRAWLLLKMLGMPFTEVTIPLYRTDSRQAVRALGGQTGLVPVLIDRGTPIWDTWPSSSISTRATQRYGLLTGSIEPAREASAGEIHSSFNALRAAMPVNTRARGRHAKRTTEVTADIERVVQVWERYRGRHPMAIRRFRWGGHHVRADCDTVPDLRRSAHRSGQRPIMDRLLDHPLVAEWLRLGQQEVDVIEVLEVGR